jgi:hypothetical protein
MIAKHYGLSDLLSGLGDSIMLRYKDVIVERKFSSDKQTLAEVT